VLLVTINTIINVIRFIMEWRNRRQPENVMYSYEQAHHQHHYDEQHHVDPVFQEEDKGWLSGLWSRSGSYDGSRGVSPVEYAHNIAYSAQKPSQNSAYSAQKLSQDPTRSTQTSAQDPTRYRQTATQHSAHYGKKPMQNEANYDNKAAPNGGFYSYVQNSNSNEQRSF
jgi:FtsZ-interacting cell division protein ZipA